MCGIAGIIDLQGVQPSQLLILSQILKHRGPDDEGFFITGIESDQNYFRGKDTVPQLDHLAFISGQATQSAYTLGLVHRRLSIIDLSAAGHQPMTDAKGKITITYNGEIYNYKEIRSNLSLLGHSFVTDSDTEVILAAYNEWGINCVNQFVGMWAFAIYDAERKQLLLSRDRFGIKPLYYSLTKSKFAFASEIKGLLELDFVSPVANMDAVLEYISFGATSDPSANLFEQVNVLPPAHNLVIEVSTLELKLEKYYDLSSQVDNYKIKSGEEFSSFNELLHHSIDLHLRSDVPVGSALSGGLDSSTIVSLAAAQMNGKTFKTFTASYQEEKIDETIYAKLVTSALKNAEPYYAYPGIETYWKDLEKLTWHQDLPVGSSSMFAQWEVMKLAREKNTKVLLDGQGADEILGGYYNFAGIYLLELMKKAKLSSFYSERKSLKENFTPAIDTAIGRAAYYFLPDAMKRSIRSGKRAGMGLISQEYSERLKTITVPSRGGKTYREQSLLSIQYSLHDLLRYEDRNSMAFSIESRVPFLDHRLVEFSIALKNEFKIQNGWTKYILRKTAEPLMDKQVVWRKDKMGFLTPQRDWKSKSGKHLKTFLDETEIPSFLDIKKIKELIQSDLTDASRLSEFWRIVSFLKWASVFNVKFNG